MLQGNHGGRFNDYRKYMYKPIIQNKRVEYTPSGGGSARVLTIW